MKSQLLRLALLVVAGYFIIKILLVMFADIILPIDEARVDYLGD